jgi:hypothetical protein
VMPNSGNRGQNVMSSISIGMVGVRTTVERVGAIEDAGKQIVRWGLPHMMVVSPHQDDFQGFNRDGSNGMPYVTTLPNRSELFLVIPIRQWGEH